MIIVDDRMSKSGHSNFVLEATLNIILGGELRLMVLLVIIDLRIKSIHILKEKIYIVCILRPANINDKCFFRVFAIILKAFLSGLKQLVG